MSTKVVPVVEGHGEFESARILITRVWLEIVGGGPIEILRPIRESRGRLRKQNGLGSALGLADRKLANSDPADQEIILVMFDADQECAAEVSEEVRSWASSLVGHRNVKVVLPTVEYETWFVGAAESLESYLELRDVEVPDYPEELGCGKGWIRRYFRGTYSETADQPGMTAAMNLSTCRRRCPSFDKLCRDLESIAS